MPKFTYFFLGCTNPRAYDYDPLATDLPNVPLPCTIFGCMDPAASNYDPTATNGSTSVYCQQPAVQASVQLSADCTAYMANMNQSNAAFACSMASQLGVPCSYIQVDAVRCGSVVVTFSILDNVGGVRADAAAQVLYSKVKSSDLTNIAGYQLLTVTIVADTSGQCPITGGCGTIQTAVRVASGPHLALYACS